MDYEAGVDPDGQGSPRGASVSVGSAALGMGSIPGTEPQEFSGTPSGTDQREGPTRMPVPPMSPEARGEMVARRAGRQTLGQPNNQRDDNVEMENNERNRELRRGGGGTTEGGGAHPPSPPVSPRSPPPAPRVMENEMFGGRAGGGPGRAPRYAPMTPRGLPRESERDI